MKPSKNARSVQGFLRRSSSLLTSAATLVFGVAILGVIAVFSSMFASGRSANFGKTVYGPDLTGIAHADVPSAPASGDSVVAYEGTSGDGSASCGGADDDAG